MNKYLQEAKEFFSKYSFRIERTFDKEKEQFREYEKIVNKFENSIRRELITFAIQYIERLQNWDNITKSMLPGEEVDQGIYLTIKDDIKWDLLTKGFSKQDTAFLENIIFQVPLKTAYNIKSDEVYDAWLNLQIEKHRHVIPSLFKNSEEKDTTEKAVTSGHSKKIKPHKDEIYKRFQQLKGKNSVKEAFFLLKEQLEEEGWDAEEYGLKDEPEHFNRAYNNWIETQNEKSTSQK